MDKQMRGEHCYAFMSSYDPWHTDKWVVHLLQFRMVFMPVYAPNLPYIAKVRPSTEPAERLGLVGVEHCYMDDPSR